MLHDAAAVTELEEGVSAVPWVPKSKQASLVRAISSFPAMLSLAFAVLTVLTVSQRFNDPDLWWHLKTGEVIWTTHSIPQTDLFSFTTNHHAWIDHEWLSEVTLYGAWKLAGYSGLMLWLCVLASLIFIGQYALCSLYSGNAKVALVGGLMAWFFATSGLGVRPHILGYLLLTCELLIVHLGRWRDPRWFFALPPLFLVWVNCHGSFLLGLVILAVVLLSSFVELSAGLLVARRWEKPQRKMLMLAFVLSLAALFVNPVGVEQVLYPVNVMLHQPEGLRYVSEWQAPEPTSARGVGLLAVAGFIFLWTLIRRVELRVEEVLLLALGFGMAISHSRMMFVFGLLAAPVLTRLLAGMWDGYDAARDLRVPNAILMMLSLATIWMGFPSKEKLELQVKENNPVRAVEFIRQSHLAGRMLNEYTWGGYLIWALPEHKVFVDGRSDVYEWTGVLNDLAAWALLQADPRNLLEKYHLDFCLLSRQAPMAHVLPFLPGWQMIYSDDRSVIFARSEARKWDN